MIPIYVVNLDRSPARLATFRRTNAHLPEVERFAAVDGSQVDRAALVESLLMAAELKYTNGAVGCALSHIRLWERTVDMGKPITICEDDAVFHRQFDDLSSRVMATVASDWDLIVWGWNLDSILMFDLMPGVTPCLATFDQSNMRAGIDAFQTMALQPVAYRLWRAFGTVCYSISPRGAAKLQEEALPLRPLTVDFPMINPAFPNNGIDIVMNSLYRSMNAYVSMPPLVLTPNEHAQSTVLEPAMPA